MSNICVTMILPIFQIPGKERLLKEIHFFEKKTGKMINYIRLSDPHVFPFCSTICGFAGSVFVSGSRDQVGEGIKLPEIKRVSFYQVTRYRYRKKKQHGHRIITVYTVYMYIWYIDLRLWTRDDFFT